MTLSPLIARRAFMILLGGASLISCDQQAASRDAPDVSPLASPAASVSGTETAPSSHAAPAPVAPTTAPNHLTQQQPLIREQAVVEKPRQVGIYTPPRGSAERVALMNALRGQVRGDLGGDVIFVVSSLHSNGEWAFGQLEPTWPDGRPIRLQSTPAYRDNPHMDGLRTEAIWRKERGRWTAYAYAVGATDVWWLEHCPRLPKGIMRGC